MLRARGSDVVFSSLLLYACVTGGVSRQFLRDCPAVSLAASSLTGWVEQKAIARFRICAASRENPNPQSGRADLSCEATAGSLPPSLRSRSAFPSVPTSVGLLGRASPYARPRPWKSARARARLDRRQPVLLASAVERRRQPAKNFRRRGGEAEHVGRRSPRGRSDGVRYRALVSCPDYRRASSDALAVWPHVLGAADFLPIGQDDEFAQLARRLA